MVDVIQQAVGPCLTLAAQISDVVTGLSRLNAEFRATGGDENSLATFVATAVVETFSFLWIIGNLALPVAEAARGWA